MRVSPLLKAVYAYRFRGGDGAEVSGTLGPVQTASEPGGLRADEALAAFSRLHALAKAQKGPALTLEDAVEDWLANSPNRRTDGERSPKTVKFYKDCFQRYLIEHKDKPLAEASTDYWMAALKEPRARAPFQARGAYWLLHAVYHYNVERKVLADNPCASDLMRRTFAGKNLKTQRKGALSLVNAPRFFSGVMKLPTNSRDAVLLIALTGWRHLAVLAMRWEQLDLERGCYTVGAQDLGWKGYEGEIALAEGVVAILRERKERLDGEEYVFPGRHGKHGHMVDIGGGVEAACAGAGFRVTPHDLRRTWNTVAEVVLNGNARLLAALDGHKPAGAGWGTVQAGYIVGDLAAQRVSAQQVVEAILETGGLLPLSAEVRDLFEGRGVKLCPSLVVL